MTCDVINMRSSQKYLTIVFLCFLCGKVFPVSKGKISFNLVSNLLNLVDIEPDVFEDL